MAKRTGTAATKQDQPLAVEPEPIESPPAAPFRSDREDSKTRLCRLLEIRGPIEVTALLREAANEIDHLRKEMRKVPSYERQHRMRQL